MRDDRIELIAEARGAIHFIDLLLSGGMDELVRNLLGFEQVPPKPRASYMPEEWAPEEN